MRLWQDHAVDDVDHSVGCFDISCHDLRCIDHHALVTNLDADFFTIDRLGGLQLDDIARQYFPCYDVVGQNRNQFFLALGQQ